MYLGRDRRNCKSIGSQEKSQTFVFHLSYYVSTGMPYYAEITKHYLKKKTNLGLSLEVFDVILWWGKCILIEINLRRVKLPKAVFAISALI